MCYTSMIASIHVLKMDERLFLWDWGIILCQSFIKCNAGPAGGILLENHLSENNENVDKQDMCIGTDILNFIFANSLCILHYAQRNHTNSFNWQTMTCNFNYIYMNCGFYISPAGVDSGPFTIPWSLKSHFDIVVDLVWYKFAKYPEFVILFSTPIEA